MMLEAGLTDAGVAVQALGGMLEGLDKFISGDSTCQYGYSQF